MENEYWLFKVNIQTMNEILHQLVNTVWVTTKPRPYHWIGTYIPSTNCQGSVHHNRFMAYACSVCTVYVYNLFLIDVKKLVIWLLDIRILYIYISYILWTLVYHFHEQTLKLDAQTCLSKWIWVNANTRNISFRNTWHFLGISGS